MREVFLEKNKSAKVDNASLSDEQVKIVSAARKLRDDFEGLRSSAMKLKSPSHDVDMYSATIVGDENKQRNIVVAGKAETIVDEDMETVAAWLFLFCGNDRLRKYREADNIGRFVVREFCFNDVV